MAVDLTQLYVVCPKCRGGRVEQVPLIENPVVPDDRTATIRCRQCDGAGYVPVTIIYGP